MAVVPIEVIRVVDVVANDIAAAITLANSVQREFLFLELSDEDLGMHAYINAKASELLDALESFRGKVRGFHPFLVAIVDARLSGPVYENLFGSLRKKEGAAVITIANVPDTIIPGDSDGSILSLLSSSIRPQFCSTNSPKP